MNPLNPKIGELVQTVFQSSKTGLPVFGTRGVLQCRESDVVEV